MSEPTRERVAAYEAALGCERADVTPGVVAFCKRHTLDDWTDAGCPVAVAAARVEAERVAEVEKHLDNVTSVNGWKEHEARMVKAEREREALKERTARAQELTAEAEDALETLTNILTALHRTVYEPATTREGDR